MLVVIVLELGGAHGAVTTAQAGDWKPIAAQSPEATIVAIADPRAFISSPPSAPSVNLNWHLKLAEQFSCQTKKWRIFNTCSFRQVPIRRKV
jgi:hypothetical protein